MIEEDRTVGNSSSRPVNKANRKPLILDEGASGQVTRKGRKRDVY